MVANKQIHLRRHPDPTAGQPAHLGPLRVRPLQQPRSSTMEIRVGIEEKIL